MTTTAGLTRTSAAATGGSLTVAQGAALSVGAVLGTGVITLPALAAAVAGPASLLAWAALVLLSVPLASTFAALGARTPTVAASRPTCDAPSVRGPPAPSGGASTSPSPSVRRRRR